MRKWEIYKKKIFLGHIKLKIFLGYKITMSTSNNNEYKPTITKGEQYVVSTSSDGKKSYGAVLSGKALYSTNSSISNKLSIGCWVTTNLFKRRFKWLTDIAQIEVSGNWSFSTGALEKGQYEFLLSRYYLSEDGKEDWLESNYFGMYVDHPNLILIVNILTACLVFINFIFRIYLHRFIHNKITKIISIALLLGLNIAWIILYVIIFWLHFVFFNAWDFVILFVTLVPLLMIVCILVIDFLTCQKEIVQYRRVRDIQSEKRINGLGIGTPYRKLFDFLTLYKNRPPEIFPEVATQQFKKNKEIFLPVILNLLRDQSPRGKEARIVMHDLLKHFFTSFPYLSPLPLKYLMLQKQLKNPASEKTQENKDKINALIKQLHQDTTAQGLVAKQILAQDVEKYIKNNPNIDTDTRLLWAMSSIRPPFQLFPLEDIEQIQGRLKPLPLKYLMLQKQLINPASEKTQENKHKINALIKQLHQDTTAQGLVAKQILAQDVQKYIKDNPNIDTDTRLLWAMSSIRPPFRLTNLRRKLNDLKRMKALSRFAGVQRKPPKVSSVRSSRITQSPRGYQLVPVTTNDDDE